MNIDLWMFTIIAIQWAIILRFYFAMKALRKINNFLGMRLFGKGLPPAEEDGNA